MGAADKGLERDGLDFLSGGGEMGRLMRSHDWSTSLIGDPRSWPQSLRTATSMCLNSRFPMLIWWGPDLVKLYNDSYVPILRDKHPRALGAPGREVWPEIWDVIGPMLEGVLRDGHATWSEDQQLFMTRAGFEEETYFTFSYSPIIDESGGVGGVLCAVTETTPSVLAARRLHVLTEIADRAARHRDPDAVGRAALGALEEDPADVPFALLYRRDGDAARLVGATGVTAAAAATLVRLEEGRAHGLGAVVRDDLDIGERVPAPAIEPADVQAPRPAGAFVTPLDVGANDSSWRLVLGIPARLAFEDDLRRFYELVAGAVGQALSTALALEAERARTAALAELDRAKTDFFTNISHEFRTPLTLLLAPLEDELARRGADGDGLEIAHRNAMRLLRLVNALLDFSRAEAGRIEASPQPTDLAALTGQLAATFAPAAHDAGLQLTVDVEDLRHPVQADPELWERILLNLLSNALKHTFEGGIEIRGRESGRTAIVEVTDTGVGIAPEHRDRIFDRFYRVPEARSRTHEGSGIGLALVAELVKAQGGSVRAEAGRGGVGTTFAVELPLAAGDAAAAAAPSPLTAAYVDEMRRWGREPGAGEVVAREGEREHHVLVVDDNADMRNYLSALLAPDVAVTAVADGEEALAVLRAQPGSIDLVLSDVMMPRLDGLGLLTAIRADERLARIPVVMLSARAGSEAAVDALEVGADDYVVKPFTAAELRARIRSTLELARSRNVEMELQREHARRMEELYDREHRVAEALQRSLLPQRLPVEPHLTIAGSYVAAEDAAAVGGDWYDAVVLDDGSLVLTIGDVAGHGLAAAAVMGQLRSATRGYALRGDAPAAMLASLNTLVATLDGTPMVTCQVARIDPTHRRLELASAGHPPAVVRDAAQAAPELVAGAGPPLGVASVATWETQLVTLGEGALLVLYTDGLIERRGESLATGLERLVGAIAGLDGATAPQVVGDGLLDALRPAASFTDDVAVLVTALGPVDRDHLAVDLPAVPRSLAVVRRALRRWLRANGLSEAAVYDLVLAVDECASNAVEHAYGPAEGAVTVDGRRADGALRITIRDRGGWRPARGEHRGRGLPIVRRLVDDVDVERGPDGTAVQLTHTLDPSPSDD